MYLSSIFLSRYIGKHLRSYLRLNLRVGQTKIGVYKIDPALNLSCLLKWFHDINPALTSNLLTWVIWNLHPLDVTNPCSFNRQVISDKDFPCINSDRNNAIALLLLGLLSALALLVRMLCCMACSNLFIKFSALPSCTPLAFLAWSDCLVLWLIRFASYSAMLLMIWRISLFAWGKSQNTISTSLSNSFEVNATFLDSLSNLATIRIEFESLMKRKR